MRTKPKTGHDMTKYFQDQKSLIKQFANDHEVELIETVDSLILSKDGKSIDIKPKKHLYTDINTNLSYDYCNAIACLMGFFGCYKVH